MTDSRYGAVWAPLKMNKGSVLHNACDVYWYTREGIFLHADLDVASYIKLLEHYASFLTSNGVVYYDVIKLTWLFAPNDTPTEIYYYAKGGGLVEFKGPDHHSAATPGTPQFPRQREVLAWLTKASRIWPQRPHRSQNRRLRLSIQIRRTLGPVLYAKEQRAYPDVTDQSLELCQDFIGEIERCCRRQILARCCVIGACRAGFIAEITEIDAPTGLGNPGAPATPIPRNTR